MFFIDKYRPQHLDEVYFHKDIYKLLSVMSKDNAIPHIIFYGSDGIGKRTMVNIFLEMLFDKGVHDTRNTIYKVTSSGNKKTDEIIKQSDYHIVIEPKSTNFDRYLVHDVVKEYAKKGSLCVFDTKRNFKIVLINNIDKLSYYAQTSLRRTMECFNDKCRFIMWSKSLSKVISPLRSRCVCLRIRAPSNTEMFGYMFNIVIKEKIKISLSDMCDIIKQSKGNIKHLLWMLEYYAYSYSHDTTYNQTINNVIELILTKNTENLQNIRNILHSIMITNYDGTTIIRDIVDHMCTNKSIPDDKKLMIIKMGADIEFQLIKGRRYIIQFDMFITYVMNIM